jgi:hypothetical protein
MKPRRLPLRTALLIQSALALAAVAVADRHRPPVPPPGPSREELAWLESRLKGAETVCLVRLVEYACSYHGGGISSSVTWYVVLEQWRGERVDRIECNSTPFDSDRLRHETAWSNERFGGLYIARASGPPSLIPFKDEYRRILGPASTIRPAASP